jgi:hypothetical protein
MRSLIFILRDARMLVFLEVVECLYMSIAKSLDIYIYIYCCKIFPVYKCMCLPLSAMKRFKNRSIMSVAIIVNVW